LLWHFFILVYDGNFFQAKKCRYIKPDSCNTLQVATAMRLKSAGNGPEGETMAKRKPKPKEPESEE
jgi:hypothetical protein